MVMWLLLILTVAMVCMAACVVPLYSVESPRRAVVHTIPFDAAEYLDSEEAIESFRAAAQQWADDEEFMVNAMSIIERARALLAAKTE